MVPTASRTGRLISTIVVAGLTLASFSSALCALPGSSFEGSDGNLVVNTLADWESFVGSDHLTVGHDLPSGQTDDSFDGKEDDLDLGIDYGSIQNNKNDLRRFYVAHDRVLVGSTHKDFLYLAWVRDNEGGSADMDFEFNQSEQLSPNGVTPVRTPGDILISFGLSNNDPTLALSRWTTTGPCASGSAPPCWGPLAPLSGIAEGGFNTSSVFDPIEGVTLPAQHFGEAAIDLTASGVFGADTCVSFGSAFVKSRSSASFTSSLKDFIRPITLTVSNCATVKIVKDARPNSTQSFSFATSPEFGTSGFTLDDDGDDTNALSSRRAFLELFEGTLSIAEQPTAGWDLTDVSCRGAATPERDAFGRFTGAVSLALVPGDVITCTFVNVQRGRILVENQVVDASTGTGFDPRDWPFQFEAAWAGGFALRHGETHESALLFGGGSYAVSESLPSHWSVTASCEVDGVVLASGGAWINAPAEPGKVVHCTFVNELTLNPGSSDFWSHWSDHYSESEFVALATEALAGSDIFAGLFDENGQPLPDFLSALEAILATGGGGQPDQPLLREALSLLLDLEVSTSDDPAIHGLQQNDDICRDCLIDLSDYPGASALLAAWADCFVAATPTVGDVLETLDNTWTGETFGPLGSAEQTLLVSLLAAIGQGSILVVDPSGYPDDLTCVSVDTPDLLLWNLDDDGDGWGRPGPTAETCDGVPPIGFAGNASDCDDDHGAVHPGAPEVCDGLTNDCDAPGWPALTGIEADDDGDGSSECGGDCDDTRATVHAGAPEICDDLANDCSSASWPVAPAFDRDTDLDGLSPCGGDCDDAHATVFPGAPESCDGLANDCASPSWPAVLASEADADLDGYRICGGDCNDTSDAVHPAAHEACNGLDDDCSGIADDDANGFDFDGDDLPGACDNCPVDFDPSGADVDADGRGDLCDNCVADQNSDQTDFDSDGEGDRCDVNDGLIVLYAVDLTRWEWQDEPAFEAFDLYSGDLVVLASTGEYTQAPGSNPLAGAACDLALNTWSDATVPPSGGLAFYLVAGVSNGVEGSLGTSSDGAEHPSAGSCPAAP